MTRTPATRRTRSPCPGWTRPVSRTPRSGCFAICRGPATTSSWPSRSPTPGPERARETSPNCSPARTPGKSPDPPSPCGQFCSGSTPMTVRVEREGSVSTVIVDRPGMRNAVDGPTAASLANAFRGFETDEAAHVAVLWGAGGTFCAGADLKALGGPDGNRAGPASDGPMGPTRLRLTKPVIAAISGHAVAGGLELALWCDLRVAEEDAVLGVFCRRWGVPLIDGGTVRLPQIVGLGRAMDMILTGRAVPAAEAYQMGLVSRVVGAGQARQAAEQLARELSAFPAECMRSDRLATLDGMALDQAAALDNEFRLGMATIEATGLAGVERFRRH